jgi:hypothetical protein
MIRFYFLACASANSWSRIEIYSASIPQLRKVELSFFSILSTRNLGYFNSSAYFWKLNS